VKTPKGFAQAYKQYIANGWNAMLGNPDFDGQDLPYTAAIPVHEMLNAAKPKLAFNHHVDRKCGTCVDKHATEQLKALYLPKLD